MRQRWEAYAAGARLEGLRRGVSTFSEFQQALAAVRASASPGRDGLPGSVLSCFCTCCARHSIKRSAMLRPLMLGESVIPSCFQSKAISEA